MQVRPLALPSGIFGPPAASDGAWENEKGGYGFFAEKQRRGLRPFCAKSLFDASFGALSEQKTVF
jgi:hypothetical protein